MLMPGIGSISGVIHLTARRPFIIALIALLITLVVAMDTMPALRHASVPRWMNTHQTKTSVQAK